MKEPHDLVSVLATMAIDHDELVDTLGATFERRKTVLPNHRPSGLIPEFAEDPTKIVQWAAHSEGTSLEGVPLAEVVDQIWAFLGSAVRQGDGGAYGSTDD